ncbi:MAG: sporulation protein [Chloroflexota bacterium]|nr:sporulation protein [Chloroflexota bacterium]
MTTEISDMIDEARRTADGGPVDRFLERLVERVGGKASVRAVFGDAIERDEVTVVPVARVRWGFGGGAGTGPESGGGAGSGGGGGVAADPVGYLQIRPDGATFERIAPAYPTPGLLLVSAIAAAIVLRALARLVRG